jgi:hypothetical protein
MRSVFFSKNCKICRINDFVLDDDGAKFSSKSLERGIAAPLNGHFVEDPTSQQSGLDLRRRKWTEQIPYNPGTLCVSDA